jgi:hypothetical protein
MKDKLQGFITVIITVSLLIPCYYVIIKDKLTDAPRTESVTEDLTDMDIIRTAAIRNGIEPGTEDWYILLAIRLVENGRKGLEFGIMAPEADDLDSQAGWCAASIVKGRQRWIDAGKPEDFVTHFGRRYCPPDDHPLNVHWVGNVNYWKDKLEREDR